MADVTKLEQALPVAPLKIVALDSAAEMGRVINEFLVNFRKETHKDLTNDPAFQGYAENNYLVDVACPRFGTGEGKAVFSPMRTVRVSAAAKAKASSGNPSAARIFIFYWTSVTTVSPMK